MDVIDLLHNFQMRFNEFLAIIPKCIRSCVHFFSNQNKKHKCSKKCFSKFTKKSLVLHLFLYMTITFEKAFFGLKQLHFSLKNKTTNRTKQHNRTEISFSYVLYFIQNSQSCFYMNFFNICFWFSFLFLLSKFNST